MNNDKTYLPSQWKIRKEIEREKKLLKFLLVFGLLYFVGLVVVAQHLGIVLN
jgi:hypothetical protein